MTLLYSYKNAKIKIQIIINFMSYMQRVLFNVLSAGVQPRSAHDFTRMIIRVFVNILTFNSNFEQLELAIRRRNLLRGNLFNLSCIFWFVFLYSAII